MQIVKLALYWALGGVWALGGMTIMSPFYWLSLVFVLSIDTIGERN